MGCQRGPMTSLLKRLLPGWYSDEGAAVTDPLGPGPGAVLPGVLANGEKCTCEMPELGLKALQAEDEEFVKNLDPYVFKGLKDKKPEGEKAFAKGYDKVMDGKYYLDKVMKNMRAKYTELTVRKRAVEHAQQRAAYAHFSKCRIFKKHYGLFLPCEETFRETMEIYRDAHQDPSCIVGASLPLKPAAFLPITGVDGAIVGAAAAATAVPAQESRERRLNCGRHFL